MMQLDTLFEQVESIVEKYGRERSNLLSILSEAQDLVAHNYIPEEMAEFIACAMCIPTSQVYEVITFYGLLSEVPRGRHIVQICDSTVCRLNKNTSLGEVLERQLGIKIGTTSDDGEVTLEYTPCFGACDISPAIRVDKKVYGNLTEEKLRRVINQTVGGRKA